LLIPCQNGSSGCLPKLISGESKPRGKIEPINIPGD
jgi:hypothetical protein